MPTPTHRRRVAVGLFAVLCLAAAAAGCGGSSSPPPSSGPTARTAPLLSMFEAQGQLLRDPHGTLPHLRELGVDLVRVFVPWSSLAPGAQSRRRPAGFNAADPGAYPAAGWAQYDELIRTAPAYGIAIDLTLEGPPPLWASGPGSPSGVHPQWRPNAFDYGAFVHAVARRYSGTYVPPGAAALPRIHMWSIWNEPNYGPQLAPQAVEHSTVETSPAIYRGLLGAAWRSLAATGHGHDTILWGELAPRGLTTGNNPGDFSGMVPLRFLRALYCVGTSLQPLTGSAATARGCPSGSQSRTQFVAENPALFHAAGVALHLYPFGAGAPDLATPDEPDYADLATVGRFERTLDRIISAYGSATRFPVYDTEFGYKTNPPYSGGAAPATAAAYLNWSEYLHWRDPRVRSYDQYLLIDPTGESNFATGLYYLDGSAKPSLQAFQMPLFLPRTAADKGSSLEVWGCARPADVARGHTHRPQQAAIQFAPPGGAFRTVRTVSLTDPSAYFDLDVKFPGSGSVRVRWTPPHGPALVSRTVNVTLH